MTDIDHSYISQRRLLIEAGDLLSDHGDNLVHDEAIVELVAHLLGRDDDHAAVSTLIVQTYSRHVEPEARIGDEHPDVIWASLSPAAKATWVTAMLPHPQ